MDIRGPRIVPSAHSSLHKLIQTVYTKITSVFIQTIGDVSCRMYSADSLFLPNDADELIIKHYAHSWHTYCDQTDQTVARSEADKIEIDTLAFYY